MEIGKTEWMLCHLMSFCHIFYNLFNLWSNHHDILWWIMKDLNARLTSWFYGFSTAFNSWQFIRPYCKNWWNSFASSNRAIYVPMYHLVLYSYDLYVNIFTCNSCAKDASKCVSLTFIILLYTGCAHYVEGISVYLIHCQGRTKVANC